ncbi:MAG: GTPase ObgE [Chloroflexota bacterium]|nr:GTPase ObgE [Chloroflexota bacterium]
MFYDHVKIHVKAGDGGDGAMHMRREKYVPRGGPDGGDGGRGGSIYLQGDHSQNTLLSFRFKRQFKGQPGGKGAGAKKHGASGGELTITVPPGTLVRDAATGELIADVVEHGQRVQVARGGRGGLGNVHFATSTQRTPEFSTLGEPGEERELELELRVIADVGLVGYPNAGKSSLLAAVSAARPKIADYPFTTLEPQLGVVGIDEESFIVADVPGLIEGAHTGAGLGLRFLRHLERAGVLIHVLDTAGVDGRDAIEDFDRINLELREYSPELAMRPQVVAANKQDLPEAQERWPALHAALEQRGFAAYPISAATREGLEPLLRAVAAHLAELRRLAAEAAPPLPPLPVLPETFDLPPTDDLPAVPDHQEYTPAAAQDALAASREFEVRKLSEGVFRVSGKAAERATLTSDVRTESGMQYLMSRLRRLGIASALDEAGARQGDRVRFGDVELLWRVPVSLIPPRRTAKQRKVSAR